MGAFWSAFMLLIGPIVYKVGTALGVGFVTYVGVSSLAGALRSHVEARFGSLPAQMLDMLALLEVDTAFGLMLSALSVRATLAGWNHLGRKRAQVWRKPGEQNIEA